MKIIFTKKRFVLLIACIISFFVMHTIFSQSKNHHLDSSALSAVNVNVVHVKLTDVPRQVSAIGSLYAKHKVDISPQIAGQIKAVLFHYGDHVQEGQVLYKLDDSLYKAKLQAAQSDLAFNKITYERFLKLMNTGAVSRQMIDRVKSNYLDAESKLNVVKVGLGNTKIKAPFSGVVGASRVNVGQYVTVGESLLSLIDKTNLIVKFSVPENNLNQIAKNQLVTLRVNNIPNHLFQGVVNYISPSVDPNTRTVMVWANVPNINNQLAPGLFVRVTLTIGNKKNAILIPQEALIPTVEGNDVFIIRHGKAYQQSIVVGDNVDNNIIVLKGLKAGDEVVVQGQEKLTNGRSVSVLSK